NTRTARRRFRCGGRDRQKRDMAYPGECRRSHISFPCVPPWLGKIQVPYLSEPHPDCQEGSHFFSGGSTAFMPSPLGGRSGDVLMSDRTEACIPKKPVSRRASPCRGRRMQGEWRRYLGCQQGTDFPPSPGSPYDT